MQSSPKPRWDWLSAGLLLGLVLTAAVRLAATEWTDYLYIGETTALIGTCLGLLFGLSRFRAWTVRGMALAYTLLLVPSQLTPLSETDLPLREKLTEIGLRFSAAALTFWRGQKVDDPILFIAFIALALWLLGMISGHGLARQHNILLTVLPSAVTILIVQVYDPKPPSRLWYLALYLLLMLLLIGRLYFLENRERWQARRILQLPETEGDLTNGLMVIAAAIILVAWSLPLSLSSLREATEMWKNITRPFEPLRENAERALDPLESPYGDRESGNFYGEDLPLGRGIPLSNSLVFRVRVPEDLENPPPRFYWRGRVYSFYDGTQWINTEIARTPFESEEGSLIIPESEGREIGEFQIINAIEQSMIYAPSQPTWASASGEMLYQPGPESEVDLISLEASSPIPARSSYRVRTALANPSIEELRTAGETYPEWVTDRYLQLPPTLSPRITDLAQEIAGGQPNPYDKALAITLWLRGNIEYQSVIPAPPPNSDALEWVLFEYKRGFCMYYASAEVLMLRSLGVPARMAVGFAEGELDEENNSYTIRREQYHAWPEVYFPGIGWVEFEPTSSQDDIIRPISNVEVLLSTPVPRPQVTVTPLDVDPADREKDEEGLTPVVPWLETNRNAVLWTLFALLLVTLWLLNQRTGWVGRIPLALEERAERRGTPLPRWIRIWAAWTRLSPVARSFETVNLSLRLLGDPQPMHATPQERAGRLILLIPGIRTSVHALTDLHAMALYAGAESNASTARRHAFVILFASIWARLLQLGHYLEERFSRPDSFR